MRQFWLRRKYDILSGVAIVGIACALETPSQAFLGVGDIVYDPAVHLAVQVVAGLDAGILGINAAQLATAIQAYQLAKAEYQRIDSITRGGWKVAAQLPNIDATVNHIGELAGWSDMMNGKVGIAPQVWSEATIAIQPSPQIWSEQIPGNSTVLAPLASVDAIDGSATRCLDQIAQLRGNWILNQAMITNLIASQGDGSDMMNGTVGQINITNGTLEQGNEERRAQTAVQACLVEQSILSNKLQRDMRASALNAQSQTLVELTTMPTGPDGNDTFTHQIP